jgi:hypothetical protein
MDHVTLVNKEVNIVAYYFKNNSRRLRCFPKRMEYDGRRINFTETGNIQPVEYTEGEVHIFDMSDGEADYRLEFDAAALSWTLVAIPDVNGYAPVSTQFAPAA